MKNYGVHSFTAGLFCLLVGCAHYQSKLLTEQAVQQQLKTLTDKPRVDTKHCDLGNAFLLTTLMSSYFWYCKRWAKSLPTLAAFYSHTFYSADQLEPE